MEVAEAADSSRVRAIVKKYLPNLVARDRIPLTWLAGEDGRRAWGEIQALPKRRGSKKGIYLSRITDCNY